jgi:glycosyltransferase involved in cell wall biosynthesis
VVLLKQLRICVNSQTPFVKFLLSSQELLDKYGLFPFPVRLEDLSPGIDYQYTPGGVTAMLYPLLERMHAQAMISDPVWVCLGSGAPEEVLVDRLRLYHVQLSAGDLSKYANFKEAIWNEIHGVGVFEIKPEEYEAFVRYNWKSSEIMLKLLRDTDLYFIHDFQQLLTGGLIGPSAPAVLQWHIPFRIESVSPKLKSFMMKNIEGFDSIIVSTRRDLEGLIHAGYRGHAYQLYPYIDRQLWPKASEENIRRFVDLIHLKQDEKVLLIVARMDSIKGQDVAIKAISHLLKHRNDLKLVMIGNGSFSGSEKGGLALSKTATWKRYLNRLIQELKLEGKALLVGYQPSGIIQAAYEKAEMTLVPSKAEGFNLTTIESWHYKKPVVVSDGAGSSELVIDSVNGYTFKSGDDSALTEKIEILLDKSEESAKLGEKGYDSSAICDIERNISLLNRVFEETLQTYR